MDRLDESRLLEPGVRRGRQYSVGFARSESDVRDAQRLRWQVFGEEMGARLSSREPGIDQDFFDRYCDHLVVRDEISGEVVGTYRLLAPEAARRVGAFYSESEFDLTPLRGLRARMVEVGRSCIHPAHRTGAVIALLWSALARYMVERGHRTLVGCASMGMADGGHGAASAWAHLSATHLAPPEYRVRARCRLSVEDLDATRGAVLPPLLKGYLRCGAWICGEPAWDPDFNTADFFVLLPMSAVAPRYARHFLGAPAAH
ncbi:MAG: GNAT family N-acetyltransferase [Proteobacteria bacterium]|nr:GNAT family N-acetyltransferase [Pseudomonadota bacterium]